MEFKSGMLGCCIIVLMLGASVFGTILLSTDTNTHDVTKYKFETEITGLFPVDNSPEFMDYDLARNYTGYYTINSVINGVKYWDGATFTPTGVNNYPIRYEPTNSETITKTINLTNNASMENADVPLNPQNSQFDYYNKQYSVPTRPSMGTFAYSKTLTSVIDALGLGGYDVIEIIGDVPSLNTPNEKLLFFGTADQFNHPVDNSSTMREAYYVEYGFYSTYPQDEGYNVACHSCRIDMATRMVNYYYNDVVSSSTFQRSVRLDDAVLSYSMVGLSDVYDNGVLVQTGGITFTVKQYDVAVIDYMNINEGVTVTGVIV